MSNILLLFLTIFKRNKLDNFTKTVYIYEFTNSIEKHYINALQGNDLN